MTKEELNGLTKKDWAQNFVDFVNGLLKETCEMNKEMYALLLIAEQDKDCGATIAKASQLDKDINRVVDYIDRFYKEKGLKVNQ